MQTTSAWFIAKIIHLKVRRSFNRITENEHTYIVKFFDKKQHKQHIKIEIHWTVKHYFIKQINLKQKEFCWIYNAFIDISIFEVFKQNFVNWCRRLGSLSLYSLLTSWQKVQIFVDNSCIVVDHTLKFDWAAIFSTMQWVVHALDSLQLFCHKESMHRTKNFQSLRGSARRKTWASGARVLKSFDWNRLLITNQAYFSFVQIARYLYFDCSLPSYPSSDIL